MLRLGPAIAGEAARPGSGVSAPMLEKSWFRTATFVCRSGEGQGGSSSLESSNRDVLKLQGGEWQGSNIYI